MARLSKVILATYVAASYASFDDVSNRRKLSTDDVHGSLRRAAADINDKKEWTTKPRNLEGDDCFPVHIDFSTAGDGSPLNHKDYVKTQWLEAYGMTVEASSTRGGYTPEGMARIFDTSVFPSEDPDLNSPNEKCVGLNGAGVGVGGEPESLGENCNPNGEGNVLIIQERDKEEPDDNAYGGSISFSFQEKVFLDRIGLLDLDMETSNFFMIERADGFSFRVNFDPLGDNSIQEETFGVEDVTGFWGVSAGATRSIGLGVSKFLQRNSRFIRKLIVISKRNISNVRKFADAIATIFAEVSVRTLSDIIKESLSWSDYLLLFGSILLTIAGAAATGGASIAVNVASTGLALFQFIQALLKVEPACADPTQAPFLPTLPASLSPSPSGFTPEPSTFPFSSIPPSGRGPSIPPTIPPTIPPSIPPTMPPSASPSGPFPSSSPTGQPSDSPTKSPSTDPGPAPTPNDVLSSLPSESNMPSAVPTESAR